MPAAKLFRICFIPASLLLFLLFIPTQLPRHPSIAILRPTTSVFVRPGSGDQQRQYPVTFAYLISASRGDVPRLRRLLHALYHPGNYYLIHLDADAPPSEHRELAGFVSGNAVFGQIGNVWVVGKPSLVTYRGPTMLATTLHAMSLLLRTANWDWFINLSASDYPLVTQDGMVSGSHLPVQITLSLLIHWFRHFTEIYSLLFLQIWSIPSPICQGIWTSYSTPATLVGNCKILPYAYSSRLVW